MFNNHGMACLPYRDWSASRLAGQEPKILQSESEGSKESCISKFREELGEKKEEYSEYGRIKFKRELTERGEIHKSRENAIKELAVEELELKEELQKV